MKKEQVQERILHPANGYLMLLLGILLLIAGDVYKRQSLRSDGLCLSDFHADSRSDGPDGGEVPSGRRIFWNVRLRRAGCGTCEIHSQNAEESEEDLYL